MRPGRAGAALALLLLGLLAPESAAAQDTHVYAEPVGRKPGIRIPPEARRAAARGRPELGIPSATDFVRAGASVVIRRTGTFGVLVIPALFSDSPDPPFTSDELDRTIFGSSSGGTTSLPDYYSDVSGGRLRIVGGVAPWVRTSVSLSEAAGSLDGHGYVGPRLRDFVREAIERADAVVDFGQYDDDGPDGIPNSGDDDGVVDALDIEFAEVAGSCGGPGPWPHLGPVADDGTALATSDRQPNGEPIYVPLYIMASMMDCTGTEPEGGGVRAHELGHVLGLPDLYVMTNGIEPGERWWSVGCFDLMAGGAWGCGSGALPVSFGPTGLSPLMKERLGWLTMVEVDSADHREYVLSPVSTSDSALRVPLDPGGTEAFIIEYRTRTGPDQELPAGGVLIYDEDELGDTEPVPDGLPPALPYHLVEADGDYALRRLAADGGDRGDAADVFALNGAAATLDDTTSPSTRNHLGGSTTLTIHSIAIQNGRAHVVLSVGGGFRVTSSDLPDTAPVASPVSGLVRVAGGTPPYAVSLAAGRLPDGLHLAADPDGARIEGAAEEIGTFTFGVAIRDAGGERVARSVRLELEDQDLPPSALVGGLMGGSELPAVVATYLDRAGNRDGTYDVGDLRAYAIRTGRAGGGP